MANDLSCTDSYAREGILALLEETHPWPNWSFVDRAMRHLDDCSFCQNEFVNARDRLIALRRDLGQETRDEVFFLRNSYLAEKYAAEVTDDEHSQSKLLAQLAAAGHRLGEQLWSVNTSGVPFEPFSPLFFPDEVDEEATDAMVGASDFFATLSPEDQEFVASATAASRVFFSPWAVMGAEQLSTIQKEEDPDKLSLLFYEWAIEQSPISAASLRRTLELGAANIAKDYLRVAQSHAERNKRIQPGSVDKAETPVERAAFDELLKELLRNFGDFEDSMKAGQMELIRLAEEKKLRATLPSKEGPVQTAPGAERPDRSATDDAKEQHYRINVGATGFSYETIFRPYLKGSDQIVIEDPYIRTHHQLINFLRFCEIVVRIAKPKKICLITKFDNQNEADRAMATLEIISRSLKERNVDLEIKLNRDLHDRQVRLNSGWTVKIGRGPDIYQPTDERFGLGAHDLDLRHCRETTVDIFPTQRSE